MCTHLNILIVKVIIHAIKATNSTDAKALCFMPRDEVAEVPEVPEHEVESVVTASNARLKLAESKTMKNRSSIMSLTFDFADRKPSGWPEYSSRVIRMR